jgi:hypothetical protein
MGKLVEEGSRVETPPSFGGDPVLVDALDGEDGVTNELPTFADSERRASHGSRITHTKGNEAYHRFRLMPPDKLAAIGRALGMDTSQLGVALFSWTRSPGSHERVNPAVESATRIAGKMRTWLEAGGH